MLAEEDIVPESGSEEEIENNLSSNQSISSSPQPTKDPQQQRKNQQQLEVDSGSNKLENPIPLPQDEQKKNQQSGLIKVGDLVVVEARLWPGINKPGGVAAVLKVSMDGQESTRLYDVRYVFGGSDKKVEEEFIQPYVLDTISANRERHSRNFFHEEFASSYSKEKHPEYEKGHSPDRGNDKANKNTEKRNSLANRVKRRKIQARRRDLSSGNRTKAKVHAHKSSKPQPDTNSPTACGNSGNEDGFSTYADSTKPQSSMQLTEFGSEDSDSEILNSKNNNRILDSESSSSSSGNSSSSSSDNNDQSEEDEEIGGYASSNRKTNSKGYYGGYKHKGQGVDARFIQPEDDDPDLPVDIYRKTGFIPKSNFHEQMQQLEEISAKYDKSFSSFSSLQRQLSEQVQSQADDKGLLKQYKELQRMHKQDLVWSENLIDYLMSKTEHLKEKNMTKTELLAFDARSLAYDLKKTNVQELRIWLDNIRHKICPKNVVFSENEEEDSSDRDSGQLLEELENADNFFERVRDNEKRSSNTRKKRKSRKGKSRENKRKRRKGNYGQQKANFLMNATTKNDIAETRTKRKSKSLFSKNLSRKSNADDYKDYPKGKRTYDSTSSSEEEILITKKSGVRQLRISSRPSYIHKIAWDWKRFKASSERKASDIGKNSRKRGRMQDASTISFSRDPLQRNISPPKINMNCPATGTFGNVNCRSESTIDGSKIGNDFNIFSAMENKHPLHISFDEISKYQIEKIGFDISDFSKNIDDYIVLFKCNSIDAESNIFSWFGGSDEDFHDCVKRSLRLFTNHILDLYKKEIIWLSEADISEPIDPRLDEQAAECHFELIQLLKFVKEHCQCLSFEKFLIYRLGIFEELQSCLLQLPSVGAIMFESVHYSRFFTLENTNSTPFLTSLCRVYWYTMQMILLMNKFWHTEYKLNAGISPEDSKNMAQSQKQLLSQFSTNNFAAATLLFLFDLHLYIPQVNSTIGFDSPSPSLSLWIFLYKFTTFCDQYNMKKDEAFWFLFDFMVESENLYILCRNFVGCNENNRQFSQYLVSNRKKPKSDQSENTKRFPYTKMLEAEISWELLLLLAGIHQRSATATGSKNSTNWSIVKRLLNTMHLLPFSEKFDRSISAFACENFLNIVAYQRNILRRVLILLDYWMPTSEISEMLMKGFVLASTIDFSTASTECSKYDCSLLLDGDGNCSFGSALQLNSCKAIECKRAHINCQCDNPLNCPCRLPTYIIELTSIANNHRELFPQKIISAFIRNVTECSTNELWSEIIFVQMLNMTSSVQRNRFRRLLLQQISHFGIMKNHDKEPPNGIFDWSNLAKQHHVQASSVASNTEALEKSFKIYDLLKNRRQTRLFCCTILSLGVSHVYSATGGDNFNKTLSEREMRNLRRDLHFYISELGRVGRAVDDTSPVVQSIWVLSCFMLSLSLDISAAVEELNSILYYLMKKYQSLCKEKKLKGKFLNKLFSKKINQQFQLLIGQLELTLSCILHLERRMVQAIEDSKAMLDLHSASFIFLVNSGIENVLLTYNDGLLPATLLFKCLDILHLMLHKKKISHLTKVWKNSPEVLEEEIPEVENDHRSRQESIAVTNNGEMEEEIDEFNDPELLNLFSTIDLPSSGVVSQVNDHILEVSNENDNVDQLLQSILPNFNRYIRKNLQRLVVSFPYLRTCLEKREDCENVAIECLANLTVISKTNFNWSLVRNGNGNKRELSSRLLSFMLHRGGLPWASENFVQFAGKLSFDLYRTWIAALFDVNGLFKNEKNFIFSDTSKSATEQHWTYLEVIYRNITAMTQLNHFRLMMDPDFTNIFSPIVSRTPFSASTDIEIYYAHKNFFYAFCDGVADTWKCYQNEGKSAVQSRNFRNKVIDTNKSFFSVMIESIKRNRELCLQMMELENINWLLEMKTLLGYLWPDGRNFCKTESIEEVYNIAERLPNSCRNLLVYMSFAYDCIGIFFNCCGKMVIGMDTVFHSCVETFFPSAYFATKNSAIKELQVSNKQLTNFHFQSLINKQKLKNDVSIYQQGKSIARARSCNVIDNCIQSFFEYQKYTILMQWFVETSDLYHTTGNGWNSSLVRVLLLNSLDPEGELGADSYYPFFGGVRDIPRFAFYLSKGFFNYKVVDQIKVYRFQEFVFNNFLPRLLSGVRCSTLEGILPILQFIRAFLYCRRILPHRADQICFHANNILAVLNLLVHLLLKNNICTSAPFPFLSCIVYTEMCGIFEEILRLKWEKNCDQVAYSVILLLLQCQSCLKILMRKSNIIFMKSGADILKDCVHFFQEPATIENRQNTSAEIVINQHLLDRSQSDLFDKIRILEDLALGSENVLITPSCIIRTD